MEDTFLLRYPQKGDSLFNESDNGHYNISLDPYVSLGPLGDNWAKYISGYKDAADILADKIIDNRSIQDSLVFPTIFLYRHSLELSMKLIIRDGYELYDINKKYDKIHTFEKLWKECRGIIERGWNKLYPIEYYEILNTTENIIKEFSRNDQTSQECRYPESRDGNITKESLSHINPINMKALMEKIYNFLNDMGDGISIALSNRRDF